LNEEEAKRKKRERDNEPGLKLHRGMRVKGMPEGKTFITKLSGERSALIGTAQNFALSLSGAVLSERFNLQPGMLPSAGKCRGGCGRRRRCQSARPSARISVRASSSPDKRLALVNMGGSRRPPSLVRRCAERF
jgi:hypothetical protein